MVKQYLDINTCHLKENTINGLDSESFPISYQYKEGVFIKIPEKTFYEELNVDEPRDLINLLNYAWKNGISLIRLDRDADIMEELPVYDW